MTGVIINPDIDKIYDEQEFPLNTPYRDNGGREFVYLKYNEGDDGIDAVAGYFGIGLDSAYPDGEVTCDYSSSTVAALANDGRGWAQAAFTDGKFGWWQTKGRNRKALLTDAGVTQGQRLMKHATTDGAVDSWASGQALGVALEVDTATALAIGQAYLNLGT